MGCRRKSFLWLVLWLQEEISAALSTNCRKPLNWTCTGIQQGQSLSLLQWSSEGPGDHEDQGLSTVDIKLWWDGIVFRGEQQLQSSWQERGEILSENSSRWTGRSDYHGALCAALGKFLPPFVIFNGKIPPDPQGFPKDTKICCSPSGYMNREHFLQFLEHFEQHRDHLQRRKVILIMDGHGSHVSTEAVQFAQAHDLELVCIPPHSSHRLLPLDTYFKKLWSRNLGNFWLSRMLFGSQSTNFLQSSVLLGMPWGTAEAWWLTRSTTVVSIHHETFQMSWISWNPCRMEIPSAQKLVRRASSRLQMLPIRLPFAALYLVLESSTKTLQSHVSSEGVATSTSASRNLLCHINYSAKFASAPCQLERHISSKRVAKSASEPHQRDFASVSSKMKLASESTPGFSSAASMINAPPAFSAKSALRSSCTISSKARENKAVKMTDYSCCVCGAVYRNSKENWFRCKKCECWACESCFGIDTCGNCWMCPHVVSQCFVKGWWTCSWLPLNRWCFLPLTQNIKCDWIFGPYYPEWTFATHAYLCSTFTKCLEIACWKVNFHLPFIN